MLKHVSDEKLAEILMRDCLASTRHPIYKYTVIDQSEIYYYDYGKIWKILLENDFNLCLLTEAPEIYRAMEIEVKSKFVVYKMQKEELFARYAGNILYDCYCKELILPTIFEKGFCEADLVYILRRYGLKMVLPSKLHPYYRILKIVKD